MMEQFFVNYVLDNGRDFGRFVVSDPQGLEYIRIHRPDIYYKLTGM